jgi:hypothetical protein
MAKRGRPKLSKLHKAGFSGPTRRVGRPKKSAITWQTLYDAAGNLRSAGKKRGRPKGSKNSTGGKKVRATIIFD